MDRHVTSLLSSYEEEISQIDSQQWEQDLPTRISEIKCAKKTRLKSEMIDVDLVRGSTFPKSKVRRSFFPLFLQSVLSLVFFPLQVDWWITRSSLLVYSAGCFVYFSSLFNIFLHFSCDKGTDLEERDILEPVIMFGLLVFLQTYIHHNPRDRRKTSSSSLVASRALGPGRKQNTKIYTRKPSSDDLFSWNKSNKIYGQSISMYQETCSDVESISGNICSDNDSLEEELDPLSPASNSEQESNSEASEPSDDEDKVPRSLRKVSREKKSERFKSSRENSNETNRRLSPTTLKIGCTVWNNEEPFKVHLSALEIGSAIFERSCELPDSNLYAGAAVVFASTLAAIPAIFKHEEIQLALGELLCFNNIIQITKSVVRMDAVSSLTSLCDWYVASRMILLDLFIVRFLLLGGFFFLLAVTERAFRRKFVIAKLFSQITSTRRSIKSHIPHFRLYKVRNIKGWLCVRSFLRKRGPKRSIDLIVSVGILVTILNLLYLCYQLLKEEDPILTFNKTNVEVICYGLFVGAFIIRFITLSARINQKYMNLTVLLTEQINLYLRMEEKPQKKEQLLLANNVLKLSSDLLKELDKRSHDILGLSTNPLLYNITKLIILSAVSGALSEMLGFKLKLYKVKIK